MPSSLVGRVSGCSTASQTMLPVTRSASLPPLRTRVVASCSTSAMASSRRLPERFADAAIAALQRRGHALGQAGGEIPARQPVLDQHGGQLLAGVRIEAMQQPPELLELRRAGQAQQLRRLAAPFAVQVVVLEVVSAVGLAEVVFRPFRVFERHHVQHELLASRLPYHRKEATQGKRENVSSLMPFAVRRRIERYNSIRRAGSSTENKGEGEPPPVRKLTRIGCAQSHDGELSTLPEPAQHWRRRGG